MNRATPRMRIFAQRLIAYEERNKTPSQAKASLTFILLELRPQLANLMGTAGFAALLSRALAMASLERPWLRSVHERPDGSLENWSELEAQVAAAEFLDGKIVLLAHLLGLLVAFIGENLMLRLVRDVWPNLPPNDLELGEESTYE
ncbi:MAG TPA: hypothetical protein VK629_21365 [Steroidobacteraceae bacterium]|nr:hypothetical protein [Steroidobacteraceae bacterium]